MYFLHLHIRKQYQRLYELYLEEILTLPQTGEVKEECNVDTLREIASDIKAYSETLPTAKNKTSGLLGILTTIGTLFAIFGITLPLQSPDRAGFEVILIVGFYSFFYIVPIVTSPLVIAFTLKRFIQR